jgi:hypothetical protein
MERFHRSTAPVAATLICGAMVAEIALSTPGTGDYVIRGPVAGDNAGPAINALAHGSVAGLFSHQPSMGLASIILRAPFAGAAGLLGGGNMLVYRVGALACLLPLAAFAAWMAVRRRGAVAGWLPGVLAAGVLLLSPALAEGVRAGHPEGALAGVLGTAAVIAAMRGRATWAAVLLGLAIGTKQWALIAVLPVLMALPDRRMATGTIAGGLAVLLTVAAPLTDPSAFARAAHTEGLTHWVNDYSLWWPLSSPFHLSSGALAPARLLPFGFNRSTATMVALLVALPLCALSWIRARRQGGTFDPLALLALLGMLRCACDSTTLEYYYLAALIPLAAWEAVGLERLPVMTALAATAVALISGDALHDSPVLLSAASISWTLILCGYLASRAFHAEPSSRGLRQEISADRVRTLLSGIGNRPHHVGSGR